VILCAGKSYGATFGRVVPLVGGASDLALDEARGRVYLTSSLLNQVQIYSIANQSLPSVVQTDLTPLSAALSRDGKSLYVTCYDGLLLDVIDLDSLTVTARVRLPAKPEGVAVGSDGRVLITTSGSGTAGTANLVLLYDPSAVLGPPVTVLPVTPATPTPPTLPPPSGRPFLASHSQLRATRDGATIVGVNTPGTGSPTVFVYQAASNTVVRARIVPGSSTSLSISDDGTRFMCGQNLFDTATLQVLAQENMANVPYPVVPGTAFNVQSAQGGSVFSPDGQTLYAAFDISPVQIPPATASVGQLLLNDPGNLLIRMGLQMPENLAGKMVITKDASTVYALSDSGFVILPVGAISQNPLAVPGSTAVLLTKDPCGVTVQTASATLNIDNPGRGRISAIAQLLQFAGVINQPSPATAPQVQLVPGGSPQFTFRFNPAAAARLGTLAPPHDFQIVSPEAVNIPNRVRVFQNSRDSDSRGTILPIPGGSTTGESFPDLVYDALRQRLYIANYGLNRIEIFDIGQQQFLAPLPVGQLPNSLALTPDGRTLYVANSGGESISIVDPDRLQVIGRVAFPPIPFNSNLALATPSVIAAGLSGLQILMTNGTLWKVVGNTAVPRPISRLIGQTTTGLPNPIPVPSSMAATPGGEYILFATNTGITYLYDGTVDDFVATRQIFTPASTTGYIGPVAAGPKGRYYVVNGILLNQALTPMANRIGTGLISAVAAAGTAGYAIFSPPAPPAANAPAPGPPTLQLLDTSTGFPRAQVNALEGPLTQIAGNGRAVINGRMMAVDSTGSVAYAISTSGLSIIPLAPIAPADRPLPNSRGIVNLASYQLPVASGGLISIFGQNLAASEMANAFPLPAILGGTCVTLNNVPLPLLMASGGQINAQIPPNLAAGTYPVVVHSIAKQAPSAAQTLAVSRYAPAVLTDSTGEALVFHAGGTLVNKENPASRDEPLTMYVVGLGPTTAPPAGPPIVAGVPTPADPPARTGAVQVFFGNSRYKQAAIIVDWSGLEPGEIGVYRLNLRVPGFHIKGNALPVLLKVGGVSSPTAGPVSPHVAVQ
jgi:uncharacterized protein (TIGR03437 family)